MRACAACRQRLPASELVRFAAVGDKVIPDLRRRLGGRGVHVCPTPECLRQAVKRRAFQRGLRRPVVVDAAQLSAELGTRLFESLQAVLQGGRRSGAVVEATSECVEPIALRALVQASEAAVGQGRDGPSVPSVIVRDPRLAALVAWLAVAASQFTITRVGGMNARPADRGRDDG